MVCAIEEAEHGVKVRGSTEILITDNEVVEYSIYIGNSTNEKLFKLVARLRTEEIKFSTKVLVAHVFGKHMMTRGTNGVSRETLKEGEALGEVAIVLCARGRSNVDIVKSLES